MVDYRLQRCQVRLKLRDALWLNLLRICTWPYMMDEGTSSKAYQISIDVSIIHIDCELALALFPSSLPSLFPLQ